jgi:hypothetical protein
MPRINIGLPKLLGKLAERAQTCRVEAELVSEPKKTALAYERMIERAKRHFRLADFKTGTT